MATKSQMIHFVDPQDKSNRASVKLLLDGRMGTMPLFYQMILHQGTATIFCSPGKWTAWKRCANQEQQQKFLKRHVFTFEPGAMKPNLEEKFTRILMLSDPAR